MKSDINHPRKYWPSWSRLHFIECLESVLSTWRVVSSDDFEVTLMNSSFIISKKDAIDGNESLLLEMFAHLSENVGVALKNREHPERIPKDL